MSLDLDYLCKDRVYGENEEAPCETELLIKGGRGTMFGLLFRPGGAGPHPAVLLLHGFPGNEQNLDIAQGLRRAGFIVLTFHYSGSWGSDGEFRFGNVLDDAKTALALLQDKENRELYSIDPDNIFVVGHSMGGFATLHTVADCDGVKGGIALAPYDFGHEYRLSLESKEEYENLHELISTGQYWLQASDADMFDELEVHYKEYEVAGKAEKIAEVPVLIIGASGDTCAKEAVNAKYLYDTISACGKGLTEFTSLPCEHCFSDRRLELTEIIAKKLAEWVSG